MDALLASFVAVAVAEWGDKTQLLVLALVMRDGRVGPILAGVALGALANALLAAGAGVVLSGFITPRAIALLLVVALFYAGVGALIRPDGPELEPSRTASPFLIAAAGVFLAELGDKSQFLTAAIAGQFNSFLMVAMGATAGVVGVAIPATLLGNRFASLEHFKREPVFRSGSAHYIETGAFLVRQGDSILPGKALVPVKAIRAIAACIFLLAGVVIAVRTLRLI